MLTRWLNPERIAVVEITGAIGSAVRTAEYVRIFRSLEENASVRAVVIDIDSPGGSAAASDYLHRALARVTARKPVVAFIRGMGASGAYLLGCAATRIVAIPSALVGSIGVISIRPLLYEFLGRYGIGVSVTKSGRLKDMWYPFREPTEEEKQKEQALLDEFYEQFVSTVARTRNLDPEKVLACLMQREKSGGHTERSVAIGTIEVAVDRRDAGAPVHLEITPEALRVAEGAAVAAPTIGID